MTPTHNQSTLLTVVTAALLVAACGGSDALQPLSPTAVTGGSAAALAGDTLQVSTPDTAIIALGKGGGRSGGDEEKKGGDKGKSGSGGGSSADDGPGRSGDKQPKPENVNLSGRVTAVSAGSLTVRGFEITVSAATVIRHGNRRLTLADIRIGDQAQVKGVQVAGVITASEVKVEDLGRDNEHDDDDVSRVELKGLVSGLVGTLACPVVTFTIGGTSVTTSAATIFSGVPCTALVDGQPVEVTATRQLDGTLLVQRVKVDDDGLDDDLEDEAEGLTSVPSGACPTLAFYVGVTPVTTSSTTVFHGVTCEQIAAGVVLKVDVDGRRMADGSLTAAVVELD